MTDHSISEKLNINIFLLLIQYFLVVHIGFLLLFANLKINFMVYFNLEASFLHTGFLCCKNSKYICVSTSLPLKFSTYVAATLCVGLGCNSVMSVRRDFVFLFIIECILPDKKSITPVLITERLYPRCHRCLIRSGKPIFHLFVSPLDGNRYPGSRNRNNFVLLLIITSMLFLLRYMVHEEEKLTKKAEYDALTGIPNRFFMMDEIQKLFIENGQKDYYLAMIDIDNFKNINDTYGHNTGDDALKILAKTIILQAQKHGFKYLRHGEEFLLLGNAVRVKFQKISLKNSAAQSVPTVCGHQEKVSAIP